MEAQKFDIVIIGAGPAGCACAYMLSGKGLKVVLIEKDCFPRDKICGDALSADVVNQFFRMDAALAEKFIQTSPKQASNGVRFFAPNTQFVDVDFTNPKHKEAAGFVMKRLEFDHFFAEQIKQLSDISFFENETVKDVRLEDGHVLIATQNHHFTTKMVVGADGANSIVNRKLANHQIDKKHHSVGLRQYYQNVEGMTENGHIELHFYKEILPGYFWIFPLPEGKANVGLGMLSSTVSKNKINLKKEFETLLTKHPNIKDRFKNATPLENIKGFGLPLGSKKKKLSGNHFILLGDAASLIDPFTGEGIGNAIRSGRIAATHLESAFQKNLFNAQFNKSYDTKIYKATWQELRVSASLQKLLRFPWLFNFVIKKAKKNQSLQLLLTSMLNDVSIKKELLKPTFYFKLLFS